MKRRVVSLMWGNAWDIYGEAFAKSFDQYWSTELVIVSDGCVPQSLPQIPMADLPGLATFMATWKDNRRAQGFDSGARKLDRHGRSWRHDAIKWAPQGLAPRAALDGLITGDILAWFDADVETTAAVPANWLDELLDGHDVACLQRPKQHSEIGFWAVRISGTTRRFVDLFGDIYASGRVFTLPEYHSAFVFDQALAEFPGLTVRNLNERGLRGHVWPMTPLAKYTVHKKGKIKNG